jgi:hypothetical protein
VPLVKHESKPQVMSSVHFASNVVVAQNGVNINDPTLTLSIVKFAYKIPNLAM